MGLSAHTTMSFRAPTHAAQEALTEDEQIVHVLSRMTPGATAALVEEVREVGLAAWLEQQLEGVVPERGRRDAPHVFLPEPDALTSRTKDFRFLEMTNLELSRATSEDLGIRAPQQAAIELRNWVLLRAVYGANHVSEAACDFFRNHFAISIDKEQIRFLGMTWERDVIRGNALGSFHTMLDASARHPAMLIYLDNHLSRRPATQSEIKKLERAAKKEKEAPQMARAALDIAKQRGLNENYARELLELHTLGADRGYTQSDVVTVAKAFTGWTIDRMKWEFSFNVDMHERERKTLFGLTLQNRADNEGEAVLDILKRHPGTAEFLAWKLCRWFVNDEPDEKLVKRIADVFAKTSGDMKRVFRAILDDKTFHSRENYRAKFKRPWEFVVSALRATGAEIEDPARVLGSIDRMSEALYRCADPTGFYDQAEAWRDPGAIAFRWAFAVDLAGGRVRGTRVPDELYAGLDAKRPETWCDVLVPRILPVVGVGTRTRTTLDGLVEREARRGPEVVGPRIVSVLLGSPEFQKQ